MQACKQYDLVVRYSYYSTMHACLCCQKNGSYSCIPVASAPLVLFYTLCISKVKHLSLSIIMIQASEKIQMKSNGYRDVQHTGLQSTQTRRNYVAVLLLTKVHAQIRDTRHIFSHKHPYISGCIACLTTKQFF